MTFVFTSSNGQVLLGWETVVSFIRALLNQPVVSCGRRKKTPFSQFNQRPGDPGRGQVICIVKQELDNGNRSSSRVHELGSILRRGHGLVPSRCLFILFGRIPDRFHLANILWQFEHHELTFPQTVRDLDQAGGVGAELDRAPFQAIVVRDVAELLTV